MARRRKPKVKRKSAVAPKKPARAPARRKIPIHEQAWFPWLLLVGVTLFAYANAWPNVLVFDDREFLAGDRFENLLPTDFIAFFSQSLWEAGANTVSLYRPMLLVSLGLENALFGDWYAAYHLTNILRHALVVMLVFGFVRAVLERTGHSRSLAGRASLLAALVFAVHPVLSDAVNSVFNGSDIYTAIFVIAGLWYLLVYHQTKTVKAWLVAGLCYFMALLYKESAVAMPALAVVVLWLTHRDPWLARLRRVWPVVFLLLPLVMYLGMRAQALEEFDSLAARISLVSSAYAQEPVDAEAAVASVNRTKPTPVLRRFGLTVNPQRTGIAVSTWFDALRLMVWPHPLITLREVSQTPFWVAACAQLFLLTLCLVAFLRKRPEPLLGLAFFYFSILPASRIVGEGALPPLLMDRMLYLPSVGLVICLAAALSGMAHRFSSRVPVVAVALAVLMLVPVTWARGHDWRDEVRLLQHDFSVTGQHGQLLFALVRAYVADENLSTALTLCKDQETLVQKHRVVAEECGHAFSRAGQLARAEQLYLQAIGQDARAAQVQYHLARLYVLMDRRQDAKKQFERAIAGERIPFMREFMSGVMLIDLYPYDTKRLEQAREHINNALQLQPRFAPAREALDLLESRL